MNSLIYCYQFSASLHNKEIGIIELFPFLLGVAARSIPKEELRLFLTDVIHPSLNDIDIRRVSSSLRNDDAITRGEFQRLSLDKGLEEANSVFYGILDNDTSVRKLESLYKAFLEDNTHDCHQKLAVIIKDFLG